MTSPLLLMFALVAGISALFPKQNHGSYEMLFSHEKGSERDRNIETRIPLIPASNTLFPEIEATNENKFRGIEAKPKTEVTEESVEPTTDEATEGSATEESETIEEETDLPTEKEENLTATTTSPPSTSFSATTTNTKPTAKTTTDATTTTASKEKSTNATTVDDKEKSANKTVCFDQYGQCSKYKKVCKAEKYDKLLSQICAVTCNKCDAFVQLPREKRCKDSYKKCPTLGKRFCQSDVYTDKHKMSKCAKYCGYC